MALVTLAAAYMEAHQHVHLRILRTSYTSLGMPRTWNAQNLDRSPGHSCGQYAVPAPLSAICGLEFVTSALPWPLIAYAAPV